MNFQTIKAAAWNSLVEAKQAEVKATREFDLNDSDETFQQLQRAKDEKRAAEIAWFEVCAL